jgi:UrcA family protein
MKTCLLTAAALLVATNPLHAQGREDAPSQVTVFYQDLDLTRPEGRAALDRRLRAAARRVCGGLGSDGRRIEPAGPLGWQSLARCERETVAPARRAAALAAAEAERRLMLAQNAPVR